MTLVDSLTPKETEEIKPGLFIQKTARGFRQIHPAAWNGKINWRNFIFGSGLGKSFIWFAILLLIIYGYYDSTSSCNEFQNNPCSYLNDLNSYCLDQDSQRGSQFVYDEVIKDGGERDSNSLQGYP